MTSEKSSFRKQFSIDGEKNSCDKIIKHAKMDKMDVSRAGQV